MPAPTRRARRRPALSFLAALAFLGAAALAACGPLPAAPTGAAPPAATAGAAPPAAPTPPGGPAPVTDPAAPALPDGKPERSFDGGRSRGACKLPAPLKSEDPCASDADCGVSSPCHAKACVAKAKSQPPGPDTMCTKSLECNTADANRCACFEGRCALVPPP